MAQYQETVMPSEGGVCGKPKTKRKLRGIRKMPQQENIAGQAREKSRIGYAALTTVLCLIATKAELLGYPTPFNVALIAAANSLGIIPGFLASFAGYLFFGTLPDGLVQLCSMLVIGALRLIVLPDKLRFHPVTMSLTSAGVMLLFSVVVSAVLRSDTYTLLFRGMSALLCGCVTYFLLSVLQKATANGVLDINGLNGAAMGILYVVAIATLTSIGVGTVNLGRSAGIFITLCAMLRYRHIGGAVCGALTTCGVILCVPALSDNTLLLATTALISGAFAQFGVFALIAVFFLISVISLSVVGINADTFHMVADCIAACAAFAVVPRGVMKSVLRRVGVAANAVEIIGQTASARLHFAAKTLSGIRGQIDKVTASMDKKSESATVEAAAADLICRSCPSCTACWEQAYDKTDGEFRKLENKLHVRSFVTAADVLDHKPDCVMSADLAEMFNRLYSGQLYDSANRRRAKELREILTGQLSSMEDILQDLSLRVSQVSYVDQALSGKVRDLLSRWGCPAARACVYVDEYGAKRAELFVPHDFDADAVKLTMEISEIAGCDFEYPTVTSADRLDRYLFMEMPMLRLGSAEFQTSGSRTDYSGDTLEAIMLGNSEEYFIIADGMGTGRRAKLDSMFAASLANKMLTSGFSAQTAVRLINRILRVKGWDESFSTLDIAKFDLCRGTLDILKAGAAASYLVRDEVLVKLEAQSFPLGILPETTAGSQHIRIFPGDRILLVSDGVDEITVKKHALACFGKKNTDMQSAVAGFGELALARQNRDKKDDITILAVEVSNART